MTASTVVQLGADRKPRRVVPPVLHTLKQHSKRHIHELLRHLFDGTDDALFEMADRAGGDSNQHLFFEAMRQVRLHRKEITGVFNDALKKGFDLLLVPAQDKSQTGDGVQLELEGAEDSMEILENDELEISVAVSGMVSKITSRFSLEIMQITRRLDHVCSERTITERSNPVGPYRLGTAFSDAIECLDVDIRVRIVLLKLFERGVLEALGPVYRQLNALMADAGVLPDLDEVMRRERKGTQSAEAEAEEPARSDVEREVDDLIEDLSSRPGTRGQPNALQQFSMLQTLLDGIPSLNQDVRGAVAAAGPHLETDALLDRLSKAQAESLQLPIDLTVVPSPVDMTTMLSNWSNGGNAAPLERADHDVFNIVSMFFDYILNDRNLAIPMKALIGRLQIPVLKMAIMDKSFFDQPSHPARQLLNELASAGIGWSSAAELKRDALYNKIESVVVRVLNGYAEGPDLVLRLVEELKDFVRKDHKRSALVEQRVKQTEQGKAQTTEAKRTVQQVLNQKASGMRIPPVVGHFLSDTFSRALVFVFIKRGLDSEAWQRQLEILDDLLWCMQPLATRQEMDTRDDMIDSLLERLSETIQSVESDDQKAEELARDLEAEIRQVSTGDRELLDQTDRSGFDLFTELQEIELVPAAPEPAGPVPAAARAIIERLAEGMWVEFANADADRSRCKLATIIPSSDTFIFVNRRGMKVAEHTTASLAQCVTNGQMTVLDDTQVFDRALEAVVGNLREMRGQNSD